MEQNELTQEESKEFVDYITQLKHKAKEVFPDKAEHVQHILKKGIKYFMSLEHHKLTSENLSHTDLPEKFEDPEKTDALFESEVYKKA